MEIQAKGYHELESPSRAGEAMACSRLLEKKALDFYA